MQNGPWRQQAEVMGNAKGLANGSTRRHAHRHLEREFRLAARLDRCCLLGAANAPMCLCSGTKVEDASVPTP